MTRRRIEDGLTKYQRYFRTENGYRHIMEARKRLQAKLKAVVISQYSGGKNACARCEIVDMRVLTIDHINSNGAEHRKTEKIRGGTPTYSWLRKNNFPPGFQVLCFNCQKIKQLENHEFVPRGTNARYLRH